MPELPESQIKQAVRRQYAKLAQHKLACCTSSCCSSSIHLPEEDIPKESVASEGSCGSPLTHVKVEDGSIVLDLGSGAGIDVFRASKLVGQAGKVIGVDSTPEMVWRARGIAEKYAYTNVEFRLGEIEHLPAETGTVDIVISNCVLNLVPDKPAAFKEAYRVLKPGGQIAFADMVSSEKKSARHAIDVDEWASCIAGAITIDEYRRLLAETGFRNIVCLEEKSGPAEAVASRVFQVRSVTWLAKKLVD